MFSKSGCSNSLSVVTGLPMMTSCDCFCFLKCFLSIRPRISRLNMPNAHCEQQSGGKVNRRVCGLTKAKKHIQQCRERETSDDRHHAHYGIDLDVLFRRDVLFYWFRKIGKKNTALSAIRFGQLFGFSAFWAKHNECCRRDLRTGVAKVQSSFRRFSSIAINSSSRFTCPVTDVFSCARRIRYGTASRTGP